MTQVGGTFGTAPGRTVAITGAAGVLGSALCHHLAGAGWTVRALVRDPGRAPALPAGVQAYRAELPGPIDPAGLEGSDAIVHCAYSTRSSSRDEDRRVNHEGTLRLLELSRRAGVRRFVFVSSVAAHEHARAYYGRSKLELERALDPARDLAVRPGLILSLRGGLFCRMLRTVEGLGVAPLFGGGSQPIQSVHVDDLAEGFRRALDRGVTGALTIAEKGWMPMRDFLRAMARHAGRRLVVLPVPVGPVLLALRSAEAVGLRLPVSSENLLGLTSLRHVACEADLARLDLTVRSGEESLRDLLAGRAGAERR